MTKTIQKKVKNNQQMKVQKNKVVQSKAQKSPPIREKVPIVKYKETKDNYASSVLMPEMGQGGRIPSRFAIPTAVLQHKSKFDVSTNDRGQAMVCMYPNDTDRLAMLENPDGVDLSQLTPYKSGLTQAYISNQVIARYRVVSAVLTFKFTQNSLKKQGSRTIALIPNKKVFTDSNGNSGVTHDVLEKSVYHDTAEVSKSARQIWLPMDPSDQMFLEPTSGSLRDAAYVALLFTGCAASEHIGYAEITVNLEYVPILAFWNTVIRELVPSDTTVQDKVESVVSNNPDITHQPLSQVQKIWTQLKPHLISTAISLAKGALAS